MQKQLGLFALALGAAALVPGSLVAMPPASAWEIGPWVRGKNYSVGMPETPRENRDGSITVDFPQAGRGEWDALTTSIRPLEGVQTITVRYRIDAPRSTRFVAVEKPQEAATVSLYFQQAGDTWSGKGRYQSYRWYAPKHGVVPLEPGEHTIRVRLDERWTNVMGKPSDERTRGFQSALANTATLGLAFGSGSRRSHGVYADGPARFTLLSVEFD